MISAECDCRKKSVFVIASEAKQSIASMRLLHYVRNDRMGVCNDGRKEAFAMTKLLTLAKRQ